MKSSSHLFCLLQFCINEGGKLAEPKSDTDMSEIDYLVKQTKGFSFWIGKIYTISDCNLKAETLYNNQLITIDL